MIACPITAPTARRLSGNTMNKLVAQARTLCTELQHILERMELPEDDPNAYNDYWRDRIEDMLARAYRRYERRMRLALMD